MDEVKQAPAISELSARPFPRPHIVTITTQCIEFHSKRHANSERRAGTADTQTAIAPRRAS